ARPRNRGPPPPRRDRAAARRGGGGTRAVGPRAPAPARVRAAGQERDPARGRTPAGPVDARRRAHGSARGQPRAQEGGRAGPGVRTGSGPRGREPLVPSSAARVARHGGPAQEFTQGGVMIAPTGAFGENRPPWPGRLLVVEGIDGSGKSTQLTLLSQWLRAEGYPVVFSEWNSSPIVRATTRLGKRRRLLTPLTFSLIHATDFTERVDRELLPALKA